MLNRSKLFAVLLICGSVLTSSAEAKKLNVITATTIWPRWRRKSAVTRLTSSPSPRATRIRTSWKPSPAFY